MNDNTDIENLKRELEQERQTNKDRDARDIKRKKRRWHLTAGETAFVAIVIAVGLLAGAYAATLLFAHTAPVVNVPAAVAKSTCTTLFLLSQNAVQSVGGFATFSCLGVAGTPAIASQAGGSLSYSLSLGQYTSLWVYANLTQPTAACGGATQLTGTSGSFPFSASTDYNYCAIIPASVPSPTAFTVSWSQ